MPQAPCFRKHGKIQQGLVRLDPSLRLSVQRFVPLSRPVGMVDLGIDPLSCSLCRAGDCNGARVPQMPHAIVSSCMFTLLHSLLPLTA